MKITSVNNDLVKETAKLLKRKYRDESGLFLIEGFKGVNEAISAGIVIKQIFILEGEEFIYNENVIETTEAVLAKITETKTPPSIVAVGVQPQFDISSLPSSKTVVLLENIKDAGNLGTILRTSVAFGVDSIVLYGDTVDLYNPKCVRSTVGNLWKIPVYHLKDLEVLNSLFADYERIATLPKSTNSIWLSDYSSNSRKLVMFGSEADGLTEELKNFATKNITIEMDSSVESLNLSV